MPSIAESISTLIVSIFNAIGSIFTGILAIAQNILNIIAGILTSLVSAVGTMVSGIAHTFEGALRFVLSNIVVIGVVLGALFLYGVYQQRQGGARITKKTS